MLYERGPIELFTDADFPAPGPRDTLEAAIAPIVATLQVGGDLVGEAGAQFTGALDQVDDGGAAIDLADAATEIGRQSDDAHPDIIAAAAGVVALGGDLGGLAAELLGDLATGEPPQPPIPPDGATGGPPPDPEGGGQPPPPPPVEYDHALDALAVNACFGPACVASYRGALGRQVQAWTGRAATENELRGVQDFQNHYGFLSDLALNWIWDNWIYPNLPETTGG